MLTHLVSPPRPSHLTRYARPSGQPAAVTPLRFVALCLAKKVTKEKATPTSGSGLRPDSPPSGAAPGAVTKGRPCLGGPVLRSSLGVLPRVLLRNTSSRPPDGKRRPSRLKGC